MLLRGQYETYCCLLSTAASWKTLGLSLSQSREILIAGRGQLPVISSPRLLLSRARLHMTPRKDTEGTGSQRESAGAAMTVRRCNVGINRLIQPITWQPEANSCVCVCVPY